MRRKPGELSGDELVEAGIAAGFAGFNRRRLADSHRAGLMPEPRVDHEGGGGSCSYYPAGAQVQLLAMLRAKSLDRRNEVIGWRLWMQGFPVAEHLSRERLERAAAGLDAIVWDLRERLADEDAQEAMLRELQNVDLDGPVARARSILGRDDFTTFSYYVALISAGQFDCYDEAPVLLGGELSPEAIVERGMQLDSARIDTLDGDQPWLAEGTEETFRDLSSIFAAAEFTEALATADAEMLERARRTVAAVLGTVPRVAALIERQHGKGAFGSGLLADIDCLDSDNEARFICIFLEGERQGTLPPYPEHAERMAANVARDLEDEARLADLAQHVPALAPLLDPLRVGQAKREPGGLATLEAEIEQVAAEHRKEIDAWQESQLAS